MLENENQEIHEEKSSHFYVLILKKIAQSKIYYEWKYIMREGPSTKKEKWKKNTCYLKHFLIIQKVAQLVFDL